MRKFALQWHITQRCGNRCRHCYMDDTSYDLSFEDYLTCITNISEFEKSNDFNITSVSISGGDPLINPHWFDIAKDLTNRGKKVSFLGNPELLTEDNLKKLATLQVARYQLSLDGLPDTHDYIRSAGSFERTIEAIKKLDKYNIPIGIMFTLSDTNSRDLFDVIRLLDELNINMIFAFDFVITTGNAKINQLRNTSDTIALYDKYLQLKKEFIQKKSKVYLTEKPSTLFVHRIHQYVKEETLNNLPFSMCGGCGAGWHHLTIIKRGDVLACRRMPVKIGNLFTDSFRDIVTKSSFLQSLRDFDNIGKCSKCIFRKLCRGCPADTYAQLGRPFHEDLQCPWYIEQKSKEKFEIARDKLLYTTIYDAHHTTNRYDNDDYIKAMIFLSSAKERERLLNDPNSWTHSHNLQLTIEELGLLIYNTLDKYM